jgi:Glycosyl hydrolase catalytic core/Secretion system C-terminal sorting domain/H-type lectin domain
MKNKFSVFILSLFSIISVFAQNSLTTISVTGSVVTVDSYVDKEVIVDGATELHLTSATPLVNSVVKLNSDDSWLFFDNLRPQQVIDLYLNNIYVKGALASYRSNCRVAIYGAGAVVIPHSSTFNPLTVYKGQNFGGEYSSGYSLFTKYTSLGAFDNSIRSFKLKKGYMATFASAADGTGYSRVFIADTKDLEVPIMPDLLDKKISFVRVFQWEWVTKKGWCGSNTAEYIPLNVTWRYDWSAGGSTTAAVEYVPIRQNGGWPSWDDINGKSYVTHVLGFNEPDHTEQSNLTVSQALAQWPNMMRTGLRIGSPAVTNNSWLYQFMDSCQANNYRVDFVAYHAYWGGKSTANWYNDLKAIYTRTGRPLWITEWNNGANWTSEWWPTDSLARLQKQLSDIKGILQVLDTASFIERYSVYNWVEDKRAMVINGNLTPAGEYYAANKSVMAYKPKYEVIPTFLYRDPSLSVAFGTKSLTLTVSDPNSENFVGARVERKVDDGDFSLMYDSDDGTKKTFSDTLDLGIGSKIRYRVQSKLANGNLSNYTSEMGYDITKGSSDVQYGNISVANVGWNALFFKNKYAKSPSIVLGAASNANFSALLVPRSKIISATTRTNIQVSPWSYQNVSSLSKEESVPYLMAPDGIGDLGGLKLNAGKVTAGSEWTNITFSSAFDTIPVVFANTTSSNTTYATIVRVKNITKTGFQAKIMKESTNTSTSVSESVSYIAISPGTGSVDGRKVVVGRTDDNYVGAIYKSISYGDSIPSPIFLAQMQTCNDDPVTAGLRCLSISDKFANVVKQREKSSGLSTVSSEMVGWIAISSNPILSGIESSKVDNQITIYPNPVRDVLYIKGGQAGFDNSNAEIYNALGLLVKRVLINGDSLDVSDIPAGYYFLKIKGIPANKFVKY